jgi:hypothetical protein
MIEQIGVSIIQFYAFIQLLQCIGSLLNMLSFITLGDQLIRESNQRHRFVEEWFHFVWTVFVCLGEEIKRRFKLVV